MDKEIQVIMEQNGKNAERLDNITNQLDKDRTDIDNLRIDQQAIKNGQTAILNQMVDFKDEIRQIVLDTIKEEVPKAVKKAVKTELTTISLQNPKKAFERQVGIWETIIKLIKRK